jgi:hypothetical protein
VPERIIRQARLFAFAQPCETRQNGKQDEQMPDAFGYIVDGLESAFAKGYSDDNGSPSQIIWASRCRTP